jgi:hypothetical protein
MQYFQGPNSKQIFGRSSVVVAASADVTVRGINANARATTILFMTVSFEGLLFAVLRRPST